MKTRQIEYFRKTLNSQLAELLEKAEETLNGMGSSGSNYPDPGDRALYESSQTRELRIRERERKLISKIQEALGRINNGTFGMCEVCEEEIDIERLKARPVTTLCIECKKQQEEMEKRNKT